MKITVFGFKLEEGRRDVMSCPECYSSQSRVTPLLHPEDCLKKHTQYICGTCGRCICIEHDDQRGLQRWNFPFKSLEIAKLYLRTADVTMKQACGIYEIISKNGRKSYKIFANNKDLEIYLSKNKDKSCVSKASVYHRDVFHEYPNSQIRKLTAEEVKQYMHEKTTSNAK